MINLKVANGNEYKRGGFDNIETFVSTFEFVANVSDGSRMVMKDDIAMRAMHFLYNSNAMVRMSRKRNNSGMRRSKFACRRLSTRPPSSILDHVEVVVII